MSGDTRSVVLFLISVAVSFYVQTLRPEIGATRIYMRAVAGIMMVAAVAWPFLGGVFPTFPLSSFAISMASLASNAWAWFILLMIALVASSFPAALEQEVLGRDLKSLALIGITIFFVFFAAIYVISEPPRVPSSSVPEEQSQSLDPKDPEQRKRLEFGELLQQQEQTWHRPIPGGFTEDEYSRLRQEFLKIPRPCVFRITVPPENFNVRRDLYELVTTSFVYRLDSTEEFIIEPCKVLSDPKDESPWLYKDQLDHKPEDIVVVDSVPSNSQKAKFVAHALSVGTGLRIRSEFNLPSDGQEDLIYIRVGRGAMRGFETIEIK